MISISKIISDNIYGNIILKELHTSDLKSKQARVSRTATLDGGVYINHFGVNDGDRTLKIDARINSTQEAVLNNIYATQSFILVSIDDGLYLGAIETLNTNNGLLKLNILIKQKEN